jgi:hypothetical protein
LHYLSYDDFVRAHNLAPLNAPSCDDIDSLIDYAMTQNENFDTPLDEREVKKTVKSAWRYEKEGRNYLGTGNFVQISNSEFDSLVTKSSDAFVLLMLLRRHHWNRNFVIANKMAGTMPGGAWTRKRLATARSVLEQEGKIELLKAAGRSTGPSVYRWPRKGGQK